MGLITRSSNISRYHLLLEESIMVFYKKTANNNKALLAVCILMSFNAVRLTVIASYSVKNTINQLDS